VAELLGAWFEELSGASDVAVDVEELALNALVGDGPEVELPAKKFEAVPMEYVWTTVAPWTAGRLRVAVAELDELGWVTTGGASSSSHSCS
jgi:hypothetical protein